jgi:hypothetical protein
MSTRVEVERWYYRRSCGEIVGPMTITAIHRAAWENVIHPETQTGVTYAQPGARGEPPTQWFPANMITGLFWGVSPPFKTLGELIDAYEKSMTDPLYDHLASGFEEQLRSLLDFLGRVKYRNQVWHLFSGRLAHHEINDMTLMYPDAFKVELASIPKNRAFGL